MWTKVRSRRLLSGVYFSMKKRLLFIAVFVMVLFNALVGFRVFDALASGDEDSGGYASINIFTRALQLIRQDYVDSEKTSYRDLIYNALRGMLGNLDPHSQFMEPQEFKSMQDDTKGDFGGIGVVVAVKDNVLTIVSPTEDTPGFKAGLMPGDQILKINGSSTDKMDLPKAVEKLRGEPGEPVTLTILRPSTRELKDHVIVRAIIQVKSTKDVKILPESIAGNHRIGYVRLTQFNTPTAEELGAALDQLKEQGMEAFVLDLRYNPGGLLNSAVDVCALFLPPRTKVVYTEGRLPSQRRDYATPSNYKQRDYFPMAILINNGSASGSEIVAGALRDLNRAILVGETTFGKGSVQSVIQLPDGSALRLTTAKYYTPSAQVIHEKGVSPNIRVTIDPQQERDLLRMRQWDFLTEDERREMDGFRDLALDRAVDALRGLMLYVADVKKP